MVLLPFLRFKLVNLLLSASKFTNLGLFDRFKFVN